MFVDRCSTTRLLVSVRDAGEARIALDGGAALVDVKEPRHGPLGAASEDVVREVCLEVSGRVPVSVALGELTDYLVPEISAGLHGAQYAKLGLAGCAGNPSWHLRWARLLNSLESRITAIAVAYADWSRAMAPAPAEVLDRAALLGCGGLLVDTFDKTGGSLLDHMALEQLQDLVSCCRGLDFSIVLAGSLSLESIPRLLPLQADYIAVRGAACAAGRDGPIDLDRVVRLVRLISLC